MITVIGVSEPYIVESTVNDSTTEMVTVTFSGTNPFSKTSGGRNSSAAALGERDGISDLGLGGGRTVSVAIRAKYAEKYPLGRVIDDMFINRVWVDENPYPNALKEDGSPLAKTYPIEHPEYGAIDVFSRTSISATPAPDAWELIYEYDAKESASEEDLLESEVVAPPVKAKANAPQKRVIRSRK